MVQLWSNYDPRIVSTRAETALGSHPCRSFSISSTRVSDFHGGNTGSNPVGDANETIKGFLPPPASRTQQRTRTPLRMQSNTLNAVALIPTRTHQQDVSAEHPLPASRARARSGVPHRVQGCHRL